MTFKTMAVGVGLAAAITAGMLATTGSALAATNDYLKSFHSADYSTSMNSCNSYADYENSNWTDDRRSWGDWFYCADGGRDGIGDYVANLWVRRADS